MSLRKFGAGQQLPVDREDPQGLSEEAIARVAGEAWAPEDDQELAEENEER